MKKLILIFLINFFIALPVLAQESEDGLIWNYRSDRFLESLKEGHGIYDEATQRDLDKQIKEGLDINLIPVD